MNAMNIQPIQAKITTETREGRLNTYERTAYIVHVYAPGFLNLPAGEFESSALDVYVYDSRRKGDARTVIFGGADRDEGFIRLDSEAGGWLRVKVVREWHVKAPGEAQADWFTVALNGGEWRSGTRAPLVSINASWWAQVCQFAGWR